MLFRLSKATFDQVERNSSAAGIFEKGPTAHLVAEWILQNDWMARHKMKPRDPAILPPD